MSPEHLIELYQRTRAHGNTSTLIRVLTALGEGTLVVADAIRAAAAVRAGARAERVLPIGERIRARTFKGPLLLDPEILSVIAQAWALDLRRQEETMADWMSRLTDRTVAAEAAEARVRADLVVARLLLDAESGRDIHHWQDQGGHHPYATWRRDYTEAAIVWRSGAYTVRRSKDPEQSGWHVWRNGGHVHGPSRYALFAIVAANEDAAVAP